MKGDRRHQLETNTLSQSINSGIEWLKRNRTPVVAISALGIILVAGLWVRAHQNAVDDQNGWLQLTRITTIGDGDVIAELRNLTLGPGGPNLIAATQKHLGDALIVEAMGKSVEEAISLWRGAANAYSAAISSATSDNFQTAGAARFGLGLVTENLGLADNDSSMFDEARGHFQEIVDDGRLSNSVVASMARDRLDNLSEYSRPVEFAKSTPEAPTTRPAPDESESEE
jgi:hypothetical protein